MVDPFQNSINPGYSGNRLKLMQVIHRRRNIIFGKETNKK